MAYLIYMLICSLITFFEVSYEFIISPQVMREFSLLPPIIRYKTLKYLYDSEANLQIANRYCLSIIKTFNKSTALNWLENEKK